MPQYLVNLGSTVTVEADDEAQAIAVAKESDDKSYFHVQVQPLLNQEDYTLEARQARYDARVEAAERARAAKPARKKSS